MDENMKKISEMLANDAVSVKAYETFLNAGDRLRYFGYVDKRELKKLCKAFHYTDARSFVKGGIATAVLIGLYNLYKKTKETKPVEEVIEVEAEDID